MLAIIVVPMAQVYMFGLLVGNKKHAWCLFYVMLALYVLSFVSGVVFRDAAQSSHWRARCRTWKARNNGSE